MILDESDDAMDVDDPDDAMDDVQSDDAMVDVEESADRSVQDAVECPFLAEDEADELGDVTRAGTLPFLEKLRTPHLPYLHNVKPNLFTGILESLPLVYREMGMGTKPKQEWRKAAKEWSKSHA